MKRYYKDSRIFRYLVVIPVSLILIAVFMIVPYLLPISSIDLYCSKVFPKIAVFANVFNSCFHMSLTENIVVMIAVFMIPAVIIFIVMMIRRLLGNGSAVRLFLKTLSVLLVLSAVLTLVFQLMHGLNYRRTPVSRKLGISAAGECTIDDYREALRWAYVNMIRARSQLGEDHNGVAHPGMSFEVTAGYANNLVDAFGKEYDLGMSTNFVRGKPVSLSKYWSLTHIVGMYDPFLGEANINTGYMDITSFGMTVCHELCHAKGYASETDCNIIGALACIRSNKPEFRYAGFYYIFWNLFDVVYKDSVHNGNKFPEFITAAEMAPIYRDMQASKDYWKKIDDMFFAKKITKVSESANNAFLKVNGNGGVSAYKVPGNVYLNFYLKYVKPVQE